MGCMNQKNTRHNSYDTEVKSPTKTYTNSNNYDYYRPTYQKPQAEKKSFTSPNNLTVAKLNPVKIEWSAMARTQQLWATKKEPGTKEEKNRKVS